MPRSKRGGLSPIVPLLVATVFVSACSVGETATAPEAELRTGSAPTPLYDAGTFNACGVPLRVETVGKIKPIVLGSRQLVAFPGAITQLTNTITGTSMSVVSTGTLMFRMEGSTRVVDLRGRNLIVNYEAGTATLYVGTFTERVDAAGNGVYTGSGQVNDLCAELAG